MGYSVFAKKDIVLDRAKMEYIMMSKNIIYKELWENLNEKYGLDIGYKGFMSLINNRSNWKLLYAYTICEELNIEIKDIFRLVEVDVEEKKKEREAFKKKYETKKPRKRNE